MDAPQSLTSTLDMIAVGNTISTTNKPMSPNGLPTGDSRNASPKKATR